MRYLLLAAAVMPISAFGSSWVYTSDTDPFTDRTVHVARVLASDIDGYAVARCSDGSFELYFSVGEYIGNNRYSVRYRVDKNPPNSASWGVSTEGTSVFATANDGPRLARSMMSGSVLRLEVTDHQGTPHRATYSLNGSNTALRKVFEACQLPLVEPPKIIPPEQRGIAPEVVRFVDTLGPKNVECRKNYLAALGYEIEDISAEKTRQFYELLDHYYRKKENECSEPGFYSAHCQAASIIWDIMPREARESDNWSPEYLCRARVGQ